MSYGVEIGRLKGQPPLTIEDLDTALRAAGYVTEEEDDARWRARQAQRARERTAVPPSEERATPVTDDVPPPAPVTSEEMEYEVEFESEELRAFLDQLPPPPAYPKNTNITYIGTLTAWVVRETRVRTPLQTPLIAFCIPSCFEPDLAVRAATQLLPVARALDAVLMDGDFEITEHTLDGFAKRVARNRAFVTGALGEPPERP